MGVCGLAPDKSDGPADRSEGTDDSCTGAAVMIVFNDVGNPGALFVGGLFLPIAEWSLDGVNLKVTNEPVHW